MGNKNKSSDAPTPTPPATSPTTPNSSVSDLDRYLKLQEAAERQIERAWKNSAHELRTALFDIAEKKRLTFLSALFGLRD
jgi:hypothetical protein